MSRRLLPLLCLALVACERAHAQTGAPPPAPSRAAPPAAAPPPAPTVTPPPAAPAGDPDGNDDPADTGTGSLFSTGHFARVGRPQRSLRRICALRSFGDALYTAHAETPLDSDGATLARYTDADGRFTVAFDWNRPGQPSAGGGGGQGFLRIHAIDGRLFVPDADPPYAGFGFVYGGAEGYVFVSDHAGRFAPARGPRLLPPARPDAADQPGAAVLPRAYHVLDVARFHGHLYASTGSVPPGERPWVGAAPGALHVADASLGRWSYAVDYPRPWGNGVWRLTWLVRFRDHLYAGIQDYSGRDPYDYVRFDPPAGDAVLTQSAMHPVRVSAGGSLALRWFVDRGRLYWLSLDHGRGGAVHLRYTDDGERWTELTPPPEAGVPTDIARFRDALVVLTEAGLYRVEGLAFTLVAPTPGAFAFTDVFCPAPLGVHHNALYAGGQRDGVLYRLDEGAAPPPATAAGRRR